MSETPYLKNLFQDSATPEDYLGGYLKRIAALATRTDLGALARAAQAIDDAANDDRTIFLAGNGGSSAAASHIVNDLSVNAIVAGTPGFKLVNLTDNVATVTAAANDAGYEHIFSLQLQTFMRPGDLVLLFSVSGTSPNILSAARHARLCGNKVVAFTGFDGGKLSKECDISVHFPSTRDEYGPVEDLFSLAGHAISGLLTMRRGRWLHH